MASLINTLLGDALNLAAQEAEANKATILAAAAAANVTLESAVDSFINSVKVSGALGVFWPTVKSALLTAINNAISTQAATEEAILFELLVTAAKNEAKALLA